MTQQDYFGSGKWLTGTSEWNQPFYILRSKFILESIKKASLKVLGLGFFHCYINGKRVSDDLFLPLFTDFEPRNNWPREEIVTGHRIYVPEYDVTDLLEEGENVIAIHFGGGWYAVNDERFGLPKAIWNLAVETAEGEISFCSSEQDRISESYIPDYNFLLESAIFLYDDKETIQKIFDGFLMLQHYWDRDIYLSKIYKINHSQQS